MQQEMAWLPPVTLVDLKSSHSLHPLQFASIIQQKLQHVLLQIPHPLPRIKSVFLDHIDLRKNFSPY